MITKSLNKPKNLILNIRRLGLIHAIKLYGYRIPEIYRDWRLGIRSSGFLDSDNLGYGPDCHGYEAVNYRCLDIVFKHLKLDHAKDVFLDYGCGKGRVVITAATYPLKRVIGVELSSELSELARDNVQLASRKLKCQDVEILTTNAMNYEVPDDVTVIFLFNPFIGEVLTAVQGRIHESMQRVPRKLRIVYMYPDSDPDRFQNCEWLTKQCELPTADWDKLNLIIYENV